MLRVLQILVPWTPEVSLSVCLTLCLLNLLKAYLALARA